MPEPVGDVSAVSLQVRLHGGVQISWDGTHDRGDSKL
jgi:hypothetical protein